MLRNLKCKSWKRLFVISQTQTTSFVIHTDDNAQEFHTSVPSLTHSLTPPHTPLCSCLCLTYTRTRAQGLCIRVRILGALVNSRAPV